MANQEHLEILKQGVEKWNKWREENETVKPDLNAADLSDAHLHGANLRGALLLNAKLNGADLSHADLRGADLFNADLIWSNLSHAKLLGAMLNNANLSSADLSHACLCRATLNHSNLSDANLTDATLRGAFLYDADLEKAKLINADLTDTDLSCADLVETKFIDATITGCRIYGASAWNVTLVNTVQHNLIISKAGEPVVTVDDLEVGQFIYLMLNNTKIRNVINTITSKAVLILGRFSDPQRKSVLDGLKEKLREFNLLPIVFDFDRPADKDITETVQTLAGMSMFVIVDVTNPKSTPLELEAIVKHFKIPYIPIIDISVDTHPFSMLADLETSFHWVLPTIGYKSKEQLLDGDNLKKHIIDQALAKREELRKAKNQEPEMILLD